MLVFTKRQAQDLAEALFDACDNLQSDADPLEVATVDRVKNTFVAVDDTFTEATVAVVIENPACFDGVIRALHLVA